MVNDRRQRIDGARVFFTHVVHDRDAGLLCVHIDLLRDAYAAVCSRWPFATRAIVVLPDHLHCIWQLPEHDADYVGRWRLIKARFSAALRLRGVNVGARRAGGCCVWQRRYWEHTLRNDDDLRAHVDYIHINPLKHGLVARVRDWPHSSFHRAVARGELTSDWGGEARWPEGRYGE